MANETKHTPGPWKFDGDNERDGFDVFAEAPYNGILATAYYQSGESPEDKQEAEANARLIAAAPDMFAALEALIKSTDKYRVPNPVYIDQARAALAKVKR